MYVFSLHALFLFVNILLVMIYYYINQTFLFFNCIAFETRFLSGMLKLSLIAMLLNLRPRPSNLFLDLHMVCVTYEFSYMKRSFVANILEGIHQCSNLMRFHTVRLFLGCIYIYFITEKLV